MLLEGSKQKGSCITSESTWNLNGHRVKARIQSIQQQLRIGPLVAHLVHDGFFLDAASVYSSNLYAKLDAEACGTDVESKLVYMCYVLHWCR